MVNIKKPEVTIVTPSFNCKDNVFRLLDSVKKSKYKNLKMIVVDNGSVDGILEEGRKKYQWVKWLDAGKVNIGQTGAYNYGFSKVNKKSDVIMIDSDVVITPSMVTNLVDRAYSDEKIGLVTPMILYLEDKNWVNQAGADVNLVTGRVLVGWGPKAKFLKAKKVQNSGTVIYIKRSVMDAIGGFEDWFLCYFDPDYCLRAKKAGFDMWYEPNAVCFHDQKKDDRVWRPRILSRAYLLGRNRTLFMRRHGNIVTYTLFLPVILAYYLKEAIIFNIFPKWLQLVWGSVVGYFYPLSQNNYKKLL